MLPVRPSYEVAVSFADQIKDVQSRHVVRDDILENDKPNISPIRK